MDTNLLKCKKQFRGPKDQEWYTQDQEWYTRIRNGIHKRSGMVYTKDQEWYTRIRNGIHILWYFDNGECRSAIVKIEKGRKIKILEFFQTHQKLQKKKHHSVKL